MNYARILTRDSRELVVGTVLLDRSYGIETAMSRRHVSVSNGCDLKSVLTSEVGLPDAIVKLEVIDRPDAFITMPGVKRFASTVSDEHPLFPALLQFVPNITLRFDGLTNATMSYDCIFMSQKARHRFVKAFRNGQVETTQSLRYVGGMCFETSDSHFKFQHAMPSSLFKVYNIQTSGCVELKKQIVGQHAQAARTIDYLSTIGMLPKASIISAFAWG